MKRRRVFARNRRLPSYRRMPESRARGEWRRSGSSSPTYRRECRRNKKQRQSPWIPACAGMTNKTAPPGRDRSRPVPTRYRLPRLFGLSSCRFRALNQARTPPSLILPSRPSARHGGVGGAAVVHGLLIGHVQALAQALVQYLLAHGEPASGPPPRSPAWWDGRTESPAGLRACPPSPRPRRRTRARAGSPRRSPGRA